MYGLLLENKKLANGRVLDHLAVFQDLETDTGLIQSIVRFFGRCLG